MQDSKQQQKTSVKGTGWRRSILHFSLIFVFGIGLNVFMDVTFHRSVPELNRYIVWLAGNALALPLLSGLFVLYSGKRIKAWWIIACFFALAQGSNTYYEYCDSLTIASAPDFCSFAHETSRGI
jgi:hypothetical protein